MNKEMIGMFVHVVSLFHSLLVCDCRDVLPQNFDSYSAEVQKLICSADHLGALMQYDTSGFLPNLRVHRGQSSLKA